MILNNAATAAVPGGDAVAVADGDDNFYNILTYYINQKIKWYYNYPPKRMTTDLRQS